MSVTARETHEKLPNETYPLAMDFANKLQPGEVLLSLDKVVVTPHTIATSGLTVDASLAICTVAKGGIVGSEYHFTYWVTTNGQRKLQGIGRLRIAKPEPTLFIRRGDEYKGANVFRFFGADEWPDLTGSPPVVMTVKNDFLSSSLQVTGAVVTPTGEDKEVTFEMTSAQSANLQAGAHDFDVQATVSGEPHTLAAGWGIVREQQSE